MRFVRISVWLMLAVVPCPVSAQERGDDGRRRIDIERIEVRGQRLLKDIGVQRTRLDTVALHDNIAQSLGDVMLQNTNTFIKSYGRGSMASISVRGTAPSHTQVSWNGMPLNSPMLGMVDFSMIPAYLIDDASLYTGASSVGVASGGLGGAVILDNRPVQKQGLTLRYIQGAASYTTFDEYLRIAYGGERWSVSTRLLYSSSRNDFHYTNYSKLPELLFDGNGNLTGRKYPREVNRNGDYSDLHVLQEAYYNSRSGNRFGAAVWYVLSRHGVPKLATDYRDNSLTRSVQDESTVRAAVSWSRIAGSVKLEAKAGYAYTDMLYRYLFDVTGDGGRMVDGVHSQSYVHTAFGRFGVDYSLRDKLMITGEVSAVQHFVSSRDDALGREATDETTIGYRQARFELSATASVRYRPTERWGLASSVRWDVYGRKCTPVVPALFVDFLASRKGNVVVKASITRNYRYPTLNDLYFQPGGNPDLKAEHGLTYDGGVAFDADAADGRLRIKGEVSAFDSYIDDWILWRPTFKGLWTPLNIRRVHSYGTETNVSLGANLGKGWTMDVNGLFTMTRSENRGDKVSDNDNSRGKQLPYIPIYNSSLTVRLAWRGWSVAYNWHYYSRRYTTSSNDLTITGSVAPYYMSDISLEKQFLMRWGGLSVRFDVNNLLGEEYETVLSHPMPGRNFAVYIGISPDFKCGARRRK